MLIYSLNSYRNFEFEGNIIYTDREELKKMIKELIYRINDYGDNLEVDILELGNPSMCIDGFQVFDKNMKFTKEYLDFKYLNN